MTHPGGRPSKYDPKYCEEMITLCSQGHSITGFAGSIGVCRDTLTEWGNVHPEFSLAIKRAKAAAAFAVERDGNRLRAGQPGSNAMTIFQLKNFAPDDYKDKQETEIYGPNRGPVQSIGIRTNDPIEAAKTYQRLITDQRNTS
jgi:hypothetical protein